MLVLSRKSGQTIVLPELDVELTVLDLRGDQVRIGISAPPDVRIHHEEVWQRIRMAAEREAIEKTRPGT
ncbi:MAG TPA: carbon storage regulator [Gemmataceae bacterium]|jgi:carbon storage regulator